MELLHRVAHLLPRVTPVHLDHHAQLFVQHGCMRTAQTVSVSPSTRSLP
jgi:hypothetical protein